MHMFMCGININAMDWCIFFDIWKEEYDKPNE